MFADVEGFTAWSSVREPSQVFTLLEAIYAAFDRVALKRRVFKVETVGDCYVAVSGLPEPRLDHAVTMARLARDCIEEHIVAVKKLESMLGPETGDLRLRVGLHSGPITAGVLRGERSRFQVWFKGNKHWTFANFEYSPHSPFCKTFTSYLAIPLIRLRVWRALVKGTESTYRPLRQI